MLPEKGFQKILGLGDGWQVQQVDYVEKASKVLIRIQETAALWASESCPHCNCKSVGGYDHAPERTWRHLNVCQLQSEIVCALPRGQGKDCKKGYTVRAPWEGRRRGLPQEFEAFALTLMRAMPVSKAGEILGETDRPLWRALFAHVDAAWSELSWENVVGGRRRDEPQAGTPLADGLRGPASQAGAAGGGRQGRRHGGTFC